jgi:hypothetical protein
VVSGSIPRAVKTVAPRSAGYQPRIAGQAAESTLAPIAIPRLMHADDTMESCRELSAKAPERTRLVLRASVAALVNVQSVEAVEAEMKRRAVNGN